MRLSKESVILIYIAVADLVATLLLLRSDKASEGNPMMAVFLGYSIGAFIVAKLALTLAPVFLFEWAKQFQPAFVLRMMRLTIAMYLLVYLLLFFTINIG
ncbi:MAG: DUF5658 family protein [Armatimonadota bacterium]|nr:DUF5658 family protein [bacterium]